MKRFGLFLFIVCISASTGLFAQVNYFVDQQNGSNSNNGTSYNTAFRTIEHAVNEVNPGDTVKIIGEYSNPSYKPDFVYSNAYDEHLWHAENSIRINNVHGNPDEYITFKPFDDNTLLTGDGANVFRVLNSSYLRIEGFEIKGEVEHIPLSTANALQFVYIDADKTANPNKPKESELLFRDQDCISNCAEGEVVEGEIYTDLSGKDIKRPTYIDTRGLYLTNVHHIDIVNNVIHDMPGGGLRVSQGEDINILENEIYACSRKSYSGTHALVVTKTVSTRTTDDYRIYILRNKVHHNYNEQFSWAPDKTVITPLIDEGKGISLQRNKTTYFNNGNINLNWENGRILIANNICYFNGFSGIHSNDGNRIDIINNSVFFNSYTKSIQLGLQANNGGNIGISAQRGSKIRIFNNISVIDSELTKSAISSNLKASDGLEVSDNIIYGVSLDKVYSDIEEDNDIVAVQQNVIRTNPMFSDPFEFDFSLKENSPAIDKANKMYALDTDYYGNSRDDKPDLGAIEFGQPLSVGKNQIDLFSVFPNPFQNKLTISDENFSRDKVKIFSAYGQELKIEDCWLTDNTIDLSQFPSGMYFIQYCESIKPIIKN